MRSSLLEDSGSIMQEEAFMRMIIARPEDDGPRLIYCDWLEEQGRCEYAAKIREAIARPNDTPKRCGVDHVTLATTVARLDYKYMEQYLYTVVTAQLGGTPSEIESTITGDSVILRKTHKINIWHGRGFVIGWSAPIKHAKLLAPHVSRKYPVCYYMDEEFDQALSNEIIWYGRRINGYEECARKV